MKPRARPVNPKLYQHAKLEFERLCKYFYVPSSSPIASCLVIAPKATAPFIRFCGDYVALNRYIDTGHYPIPHVQHSLNKIINFRVFLDFDWVNSFHQIKLGPITSARLSVQTPWGQVQPIFMPEGIGPASGILQKTMSEIFADYEDWSIAIFDNLLVLAHDYADAFRKVELILDRCIERNLYLKFSKTWLGFDSVLFFGYRCRYKSYELTDERKAAIQAIPFPNSQKKMQSFLGAALFFKPFVAHYSTKTAPLNDMTKQTFDWSKTSSWSEDYRAVFESLKMDLQHAITLYYPDYSLVWILRTDASLLGIGAVLIQVAFDVAAQSWVSQVIGCASEKFSPQAMRWTTIEQEAYGIYFGVKFFAYYLHCKPFILETDHNNLLWIEASAVPKVIRWRVYLQSFSFMLRHIPGKQNLLADFLSRSGGPEDSLDIQPAQLSVLSDPPPSPESILHQVHGGRMGHFGARKTWLLLNEFFSGHQIPYRFVEEFVASCPVCQKTRLGMTGSITPLVRHLKPDHRRSIVGVDTLTITPADELGNEYLFVVVNHFTKHAGLYASATHDATSVATALFQHFCRYGLVDSLISDPGSEFLNDVVAHLHKWLSIRHVFSLVDRHESNGVEGSNKQILRHLLALVMDERVKHRWSHPTVLPIIEFILNDTDSSETGVKPFHATFGQTDKAYFLLPPESEVEDRQSLPAYVRKLDENLRQLQAASKKYQDNLVAERLKTNAESKQNIFQPGDFVLFQLSKDTPLPSKLTPKFSGPYEVVHQVKNDVTCKHLVMHSTHVFHVERLKLFFGSRDEATKLAMHDHDQFKVDKITSYHGNARTRTTCEFEVLFTDGSLVWLPYSKDIADTAPFELFVNSRPELFILLYSSEEASRLIVELNRQSIISVRPGDTVYVDLRSFSATWYKTLPLPDVAHVQYLLEHKYIKWIGKQHRKLQIECILTGEIFKVDHFFVKAWGTMTKKTRSPDAVILSEKIALEYPQILPESDRDRLIKLFKKRLKNSTQP